MPCTKILIRSILLVCILSFFMPSGALCEPGTPVNKTVLVLFPYQNDVPYSVLAMQAIKDEFDNARDLRFDTYYEYLDLNRFPEKEYQQQIISLFTIKYGRKPIDLVIAANEVVLNFWLKHRTVIAPNSPVVFCDVQTNRLAMLQLPPDVTGVSGMVNHVQSVEWLLRVRPGVKEIVTVRDESSPIKPHLVNIMNGGQKAAAIVDDLPPLTNDPKGQDHD
jgi:hypothetical protein